MNPPAPHSRNLRLHRLQDAPATFFVTKSLHPKRPLLTPPSRALICDAFRFAVEKQSIWLSAFVVMPDHWHALLALQADWTLPKFMQALMSHVAARTPGCPWQESYYETLIRSTKQFQYVADYILWNPVRKGLAAQPGDWDASSLRFPGVVVKEWMDSFEED